MAIENMTERATLQFLSYQENGTRDGNKDLSASEKTAAALSGVNTKTIDNLTADSINDCVITVQYNPKSLRFGAAASKNRRKHDDTGGGDLKNSPKSGKIQMSVELVFVQKQEGDSSVKEQMELLLRILLYDEGKRVRFSWADMQIEGILTSFSGAYDMFDGMGNPISGNMALGISVLEGINYS